MFEGIIEQFLLAYLGDYIDNLDKDKLSLGIWSGSLVLENILLKVESINKLKLPFKLLLGRIEKLSLCISWKTYFSQPTEIVIDGLSIVLSLLKPSEWELLDYISYESKSQQIMKHSNNKYYQLVNSFNSEGKQSGYMNRMLLKILDNLQVTIKNINIRIEEYNTEPLYSFGITLKEIIMINTNENWEQHFIDRNIEKTATLYKLLKISNFGIYLTVNENGFISTIPDLNDRYDKMKLLFPNDKEYAQDVKYLIKPMSLIAKMKQIHHDPNASINNKTEEEIKLLQSIPLINLSIDLDTFNVEIQKEEFDCIIYILNHISKYQKYQRDYYETSKFNFFKPRYRPLETERPHIIKSSKVKNENAVLWLQYSIGIILRQIKYYKGNRDIFQIPQENLIIYEKEFKRLFKKMFQKQLKDLNNDDRFLLKDIITKVDMSLLKKWSAVIIDDIFKNEKIEEKKNSQKGYFSYLLSWGYSGNNDTESMKKFTQEEELKIEEFLQSSSRSLNSQFKTSSVNQVRLNVEFSMNEGSFRLLTKKFLKNADLVEGIEIKYKTILMSFSQSKACIQVESSLKTFHVDMFTIINKTTNQIPITFLTFNTDDFKLGSSLLQQVDIPFNSSSNSNDNSKINSLSTSMILFNNYNESPSVEPQNFIQVKFTYTPMNDINSTFWLHVADLNITYHQVFLERVISFFKIQLNEELASKAWNSYSSIKKATKQTLRDNMPKRNVFQIQIDPRKIVIPINKYDIKNSKVLLLEIGNVRMNTAEENDKIHSNPLPPEYSKRYDFSLDYFSISYYPSIKDMKNNKDRFEIVTEVSGEMGFALLKDVSANHRLPIFKLFVLIENITVNLTEYLYVICVYIMEIVKPTLEKDLWSQLTVEKGEIGRNAKVTATVLKKNWISNTWEKLLAMISSGYIYFYNSQTDEDYCGYFYLKDGKIKTSVEMLTITIENMIGTIELKFPNEKKLKQWELCLLARMEEMITTNEDKNEEFGKELQKFQKDPREIYFGGDITLKQITVYLFHQHNIDHSYENIFKISVNTLSLNMALKFHDTSTNISIQGVKIYDMVTKIEPFIEIINSEDIEDKETKLFNMNILIAEEKSPDYKGAQITIDMTIGYLYAIWNPIVIRKLLYFLVHNAALKRKVRREISNPNEKLVDQKFIEPSAEVVPLPKCSDTKQLYMKLNASMKKVSIILIQPVLDIMYHEMRFGESNLHCNMTVDHFEIKGEMGNTQIFDLCEYPFIISSQKKYVKSHAREIFGVHGKENKSLISFYYRGLSNWCPLFKDNYAGEADVTINSTFLIYVQEQFLRFLNYFIKEFLGAMGPPQGHNASMAAGKNDTNTTIKTPLKDPKDMPFMRLNLIIDHPCIILKPRIYFNDYFTINLGKVNLTCRYNKIYGKIRKEPEEWRWLSTYQITLGEFMIETASHFQLCKPTNGTINMHFTYAGEEDLLQSPLDFDFSYQFDTLFNDFKMCMRQKDLSLLLQCLDLNILYTDGKFDQFNYAVALKGKFEANDSSNNSSIIAGKIEDNKSTIDEIKLMNEYILMLAQIYIPKISIELVLELSELPFAEIALKEVFVTFVNKLDYTKKIIGKIGSMEIYHFRDKSHKEIIVSDFSQLIEAVKGNYNSYNKDKEDNCIFQKKPDDLIEEEEEKENNNINKNNDNKGNDFNATIIKLITSSLLIPLNTIDNIRQPQTYIEISIDKERNKYYQIFLENLKFLIRIDTIKLINTFFLEAFTYYDKSAKDLPNLYDSNEENYPSMFVQINLKHPLICFLSDHIEKRNQELYCIRSDVTVILNKMKTSEVKELLKRDYIMLQEKLLKYGHESSIKSQLDEIIEKFKVNTWKLKCSLSINPFVCTMNEVLEKRKLIIASRKIMNDFQVKYSIKIQMTYDNDCQYILETKYSLKAGKIIANLSFKDLVLLKKVSDYNLSLMGNDYQKNYESLIHFTKMKAMILKKHKEEEEEEELRKKTNMEEKSIISEISIAIDDEKDKELPMFKSVIIQDPDYFNVPNPNANPNESIDQINKTSTLFSNDKKSLEENRAVDSGRITSINKIAGINIFLIDNHAKTYFPFLNFQIPEMTSQSTSFKSGIIQATYEMYLRILTYNYIAGVWESLLDNTKIDFATHTEVTEEKTTNAYNILIGNNSPTPVTINISDLSIVFLYSIFTNWQKKYIQMTETQLQSQSQSPSKSKEKSSENNKDDLEKKMKVSNHIVYNYTGKKMTLYQNQENEIIDKKLGDIEPNDCYEIEYPINTVFHHDIYQKNTLESQIKFEVEDAKTGDNEIKIDKVQQNIHGIQFLDSLNNKPIQIDKDIYQYTYLISKVEVHKLRKFIYFYSPLSFRNATHFPFMLTLRRKDNSDSYTIKFNTKTTIGIPFEYLNGVIEIQLNKTKLIFSVLKFFTSKEISKELNFNNTFVYFYHPKGETFRNRVIMIKSFYCIRNCLPFDISITIPCKNNKGEESLLKVDMVKGQKYICHTISSLKDFNLFISFLEFETKKMVCLYNKDDTTKNSSQVTLINKKKPNQTHINIISTIIKGNHLTAVLHPNGVIVNHCTMCINFYYGKSPKQAREIPGKGDNCNIYLLNAEEKYMHFQYSNYISEPINLVAIESTTVIDSKKNSEIKQSIEFLMETQFSLLASDLDIYCNVMTLKPKYIVWNCLQNDIILTNEFNNKNISLQSNAKQPFYFFGFGDKINVMIEPKSKEGELWNTTYPIQFNNNSTLITVSVYNYTKTRRFYMNIERHVNGIITYFKITQTKAETSSIFICNYSSHICAKIFQKGYETDLDFYDISTKGIFTWTNPKESNILCFKFGPSSLKSRPLMKWHKSSYEIFDEQVIIIQNDNKIIKDYPLNEILKIDTQQYKGYSIKLIIQTDGVKIKIIIEDITVDKVNQYPSNTALTLKMDRLGISLIGDNNFIECKKNYDKYERNEIAYILFNKINFEIEKQILNQSTKTTILFDFDHLEIDNEISYNTYFPLVVKQVYDANKEYEEKKRMFIAEILIENEANETTTKFQSIAYQIEKFALKIESNILNGMLIFFQNLTTGMKTTLTYIHPIFLSHETNLINNLLVKGTLFVSTWDKVSDVKETPNIFIQRLNLSSVEIVFSFLNQSKDKIFDRILANNPTLSRLLATISNVENTSINLTGSSRQNVSGDLSVIIMNIIKIYQQNAMNQIMKLFASIEIFGTPMNLFQSLGTGVKDFFEKPYHGMIQGPVEGAKGIVKGSYSLVKNTAVGTFNTASKISSGLSRGLLLITQDDEYINNREKKKMTEKPGNLVEGIGYGLTSMAGGIFDGVTDIVRKPIEGAKKDNIRGFGKGLLKGLSGAIVKPVSGVLDMVSKTSEGFQSTFSNDKGPIMARIPRAFYGKFKYIKVYDEQDAGILYFINTKIPYFKKNPIEFVSAVFYPNKEGVMNLLVFSTKSVYLINYTRLELEVVLNYSHIQKVTLESSSKLKIHFFTKVNNTKESSISFYKTKSNAAMVLQQFQEAMNANFQP